MDSATPTATRKSSASVESAAATATANGVNVNVSIGVSGAPAAPVHTVSASTAAAAVVDASQDFSVHVSNLSVPDYAVFQLWLRGCSVEHALLELHNRRASVSTTSLLGPAPQSDTRTAAMRQQSKVILSQYRNFEMLEHYLHRPSFFHEQMLFPLPASVKMRMVEQYYQFDDDVVRELLGKKLNHRTRKDLDDVCEKTGISLGSCRRQFDNLKRISKTVDELQGGLSTNIRELFLLPPRLASRYARVLFITNNRLDTSRKKLAQYTLADFEYCASVFLRYWVSPHRSAGEEFDPSLAQDARELKTSVVNSKDVCEELRTLVAQTLFEEWPDAAAVILQTGQPGVTFSFNARVFLNSGLTSNDFYSQFKVLLRNVLQIVSGLSTSKEVRDIFIDLVEKVLEMCAAYGWRAAETEAFFAALRTAFPKLTTVSTEFLCEMHPSWHRVVVGVQLAVARLFNDISVALQIAE